MPKNIDLNSMRLFLAVAESGSLSGAARYLNLSQPTVGRAIRELEQALQARLFDRLPGGVAITPVGREILQAADAIDELAGSIQTRVSGEDAQLEGKVRITTSDGMGHCWLAPKLVEFRDKYPAIQVDLVTGTSIEDLLRREADVALRVGSPGSDLLVGRPLGEVGCGLYASEEYLQANGRPSSLRELGHHSSIESIGEIGRLAQAVRFRNFINDGQVALRTNSMMTQLSAARAGLGIVPLLHYMTADAPELEPVLVDEFDIRLHVWLLTHRELRHTARIKAVREFIWEQARNDSRIFSGLF